MRFSEEFLLKEFRSFYEKLLEKTIRSFKRGEYERTLELISATARYAWQNHSGVFSESKFDRMILKIGEDLDSLVRVIPPFEFQLPPKRENQKRVLHVASEIYELGGHSRLITSWLKNDPDNLHSLIVTGQTNEIPKKIVEPLLAVGGSFAVLPTEKTLSERAAMLRRAAENFDCVVLHQHTFDVIPLVAFATFGTPPVAIMNHADHVFWLGASAADLVIDLRAFGAKITRQRRKAKHSLILPIPLSISEPPTTREEARRQLNIGEDEVVLLSIGSEYKYLRSEAQDFSSTVKKILENNPKAVMYLIGAKFDEEKFFSHERLHFMGDILDPTLYRQAADIYLEGFPVSSFTALLETVALGVCPVLMYAPNELVSFDREMSLEDCEENALDEAGYIKQVSMLINDPEYRIQLGKIVGEKVRDYHCGETWRKHLKQIYLFLEQTKHNPRLIEETNFMMEKEDLFLMEMRNSQLRYLKSSLWIDWVTANPQIYTSLTKSEFLHIIYNFLTVKDLKFFYDKIKWRHVTEIFRLITEKKIRLNKNVG